MLFPADINDHVLSLSTQYSHRPRVVVIRSTVIDHVLSSWLSSSTACCHQHRSTVVPQFLGTTCRHRRPRVLGLQRSTVNPRFRGPRVVSSTTQYSHHRVVSPRCCHRRLHVVTAHVFRHRHLSTVIPHSSTWVSILNSSPLLDISCTNHVVLVGMFDCLF